MAIEAIYRRAREAPQQLAMLRHLGIEGLDAASPQFVHRVAESAKLNAAAKTGNLDAIKTAFGAVGQSCKACHDDFRKD